MNKKICFVIMGFGKKIDYENNREVDLDIIYREVIKKIFDDKFKNFKLIRSDELTTSAIIDVDMYEFLLRADLVIADITTMNPNALYELGVRHGVKPKSTIVIADEKTKIPFDLNHTRILKYKEAGIKLDDVEIEAFSKKIIEAINVSVGKTLKTDSPFYTMLKDVEPPKMSEKEYGRVVDVLIQNENNISILLDEAKKLMINSEFEKAYYKWDKLSEIIPGNDYFIQQKTLSKYKSKLPNETMALEEALEIIKVLNPKETLDSETIGLTGAIYKRLFLLNINPDYLDMAIYYYKKGYMIKNDYYNGENYINCLLLRRNLKHINKIEKDYIKFEVIKEAQNIKKSLEIIVSTDTNNIDFWMYSTLAVCCKIQKEEEEFEKYKKKFLENCEADWEKETFEKTLSLMKGF